MTKERLPENDSAVKNKKRTRRVVPPGVALTVGDIEKLEARYQGPKKNPALYIKRAFQTYIEKCPAPSKDRPGLTSTTKRVACFLVDWYQLRDGYARPPNSRIAKELRIGIASVKRAVATLHDLGVVFVKSGGPTRRQGFGTVASRYVPNFSLVINWDTGAIIGNAKYEFVPLKPIRGAGDYAQNDTKGAYAQNEPRGEPLKPIRGAGDYAQNEPRYLSTEADAHASPTADAPGYATAPQKKEFGPLPKQDSDSVKIRYIQLGTLADKLNKHPVAFDKLFGGEKLPGLMASFQDLCKEQIFTFGKPGNWILEHNAPNNGEKMGRIVVYEGMGKVDFVNGGDWLSLDKLKEESWLAIEYRVSPAYQIEVIEKIQELRTGV